MKRRDILKSFCLAPLAVLWPWRKPEPETSTTCASIHSSTIRSTPTTIPASYWGLTEVGQSVDGAFLSDVSVGWERIDDKRRQFGGRPYKVIVKETYWAYPEDLDSFLRSLTR